MKALIVALMLGLETTPPVAIRIVPRVVMVGGAVRVTCTVPRDPANRKLTVAVVGYQSSERQLDGEQARVTHEFLFPRIPCEATEAICQLEAQGHDTIRASLPIEVGGCEP